MSQLNKAGVLRCVVCGDEIPRKDSITRGLEYGWPKCHDQNRIFVSAAELKKEEDYFNEIEEHEIGVGGL